MKLTTRFVCGCLALLAIPFFWAPPKTRGSGQPRPLTLTGSTDKPQVVDHGGKIDSKYDGFSHETVVTLNKMRITCGSVKGNFKDACVSLIASLHCPGIQLDYVRNARLQLIFQTKDWDGRHPLNQRQLSVVVDGETVRLGQMKLVNQSVDTLMTEVLEVDMPYKIFKKMAFAPTVEMKVGKSEFALREQNLAALKDLNNRVKF